MKKILTLAFVVLTMAFAKADVTTNVVTNIVHETRVRYDIYSVTNGYVDVIGGSNLVYETVIDSIQNVWTTNGFQIVTNSHQVIISGSDTNRVYDIKWYRRPYYYDYPITNITTIVR